MGAVLALRASTHLRIDGQILCSLSSAFTEDVPAIEQGGVPLEEDKELAPYARMIRKNSFREVVANNITPTFALVGDKEYPPLIQRVRALASSLPNAHLKVIPDTGHDISSPQYLAAIDDAIRKLGQ
jgi:pimeloyl-ACP methyl ester carboxylesterase